MKYVLLTKHQKHTSDVNQNIPQCLATKNSYRCKISVLEGISRNFAVSIPQKPGKLGKEEGRHSTRARPSISSTASSSTFRMHSCNHREETSLRSPMISFLTLINLPWSSKGSSRWFDCPTWPFEYLLVSRRVPLHNVHENETLVH